MLRRDNRTNISQRPYTGRTHDLIAVVLQQSKLGYIHTWNEVRLQTLNLVESLNAVTQVVTQDHNFPIAINHFKTRFRNPSVEVISRFSIDTILNVSGYQN